jgi:hypothetical protein
MAQGSHNLGKTKKSGGSQKRKGVKSVKKTRKGNAAHERSDGIIATTKAINRKNERLIAAQAINNGTRFNLNDIAQKGERNQIFPKRTTCNCQLFDTYVLNTSSFSPPRSGKNENKRILSTRDKKEKRATKMTDRLQVQLQKLK